MKKLRDLRQMSDTQLKRLQQQLTLDIMRTKGRMRWGDVQNPMLLRNMRRTKARVLTILRERELNRSKTDRHKSRQKLGKTT